MVKKLIVILSCIIVCIFYLHSGEKDRIQTSSTRDKSIIAEFSLGQYEDSEGQRKDIIATVERFEEPTRELERDKREIEAGGGQSNKWETGWKITSYYTPVEGQLSYYNDRTYEEDFYINCSGDCFIAASGYRLSSKDANKTLACPPLFKLGTRIKIKTVDGSEFEAICLDRGGAIKGKRLDLYSGHGEAGKHYYESVNIRSYYDVSISIIK